VGSARQAEEEEVVARRRRPSRWASEAALQALIRFNPEESGLRALKQEARGEYRSTVRGARGAARGIVGEVKAVTPQTRHAYDEAGLAAARTAHSVVDPALRGLPQNSLSAAVKIEQGDYQRNLQESKAAEIADLGSRRVSAREGAAFAVTNAASVRNAALAKIADRFQALRQEKGAFEASTAATLQDDARQRRQQLRIAQAGLRQRDAASRRTARQSERNSLRSAGIDPQTMKPYPNGKLDPKAPGKKKGGATHSEYLKWQTSIEEVSAAAARLRNAKDRQGRPLNLSRAQIVDKLSAGRPAQTLLVATKNSGHIKAGDQLPEGLTPQEKSAVGATKQALPAMKPYAPDLRMSAALDVALFGHLTPATEKRLRRAGFSPRRLGLPTYGHYKRKTQQAYNQAINQPGRPHGPY
jgi:hypothetical protein